MSQQQALAPAAVGTDASPGPEPKSLARRFFTSTPAVVGLGLIVALVLIAVLAPVLTPHHPLDQQLPMRLRPPFWMEGAHADYPLGGDRLGRDILSHLVYGVRVSVTVGFSAILISALIGVPLGLAAGYYGGRFEQILMRIVDVQLSLPPILVALGVMAVWGRG